MSESVGSTLLLRFRQGDQQAIGTLLSRLRPYVRVIVRRHRGDAPVAAADASDLIQDVMMQAVRDAGTFRGKSLGELICWLRTIAVRTSRRELHRAGENESALAAADVQVDLVADRFDGPSEAASRQERAARMATALSRLPEDMRQVLLLRLVDNLDHAEVAGRLDRSPGAVRMLFLRALERLREVCGSRDEWLNE